MVRSFDSRVESLFLLEDEILKQEAISILYYTLKDNVNAYAMKEDASYAIKEQHGEPAFNVHKEFYNVTRNSIEKARLFEG
jgi:polyphosphate kinase